MRYILMMVAGAALVAGGGYAYFSQNFSPLPTSDTAQKPPAEVRLTPRQQMTSAQAALVKSAAYAPEVEQKILDAASTLQTLVIDPAILAGVRAANEQDKLLSAGDITKLDDQWISSKALSPFVTSFLTNDTAQRLLAFQKEHAGFKELFVADAYGLNVGQTDKTSDYYQADESWWVNAMNGGIGKVFHGNIEFDQSSETEAISIYVPVMDPSTQRAIGVLKGVLDVSAIGNSL